MAISITACAKHAPTAEGVQKLEAEKATKPAVESAPTPTAPGAKNEAKNIVVAKVNSVALTEDKLITLMNNLPDTGSMESLDDRRKRALDSLVLMELAYQRATALGLNADPVQISAGIDNYKLNLGGEKEFSDFLTHHNMTEADVHTEVERAITINHIYTKEVIDRVEVPENDLKREYEAKKNLFIKPERITAIDVYMIKDEGEASQKKVKELLAKIKKDPSQDPWKLVLDGTFMVKNILILKERNKELYDTAKKLKPQQLSGVIQTPNGPQIIKLKESSPEKQLTYDEAKPEIIAKLKGPFLEKRTHEWEQELKKDAKIELMDIPTQGQPKQVTP
jgi:parvulin-like peptidyl-prolyl isomerase